MTHAAVAFYCLVLLLLMVLIKAEHRPQTVPVVQSAAPAIVVPWRLYSTCPVNRTNVPLYKDRIA